MNTNKERSANKTGPRVFRLSGLASAIFGMQFLAPAAQALPQGGQVTGGEARITPARDGVTLNVTQFTDRAVIDWKTFDIGDKETVNFAQPKPESVMLNRVNGGSVSSLLGKLSADGRILLLNPSGIVFGPNSQVNVAGLVATTANVSNKDFMAGQMNFAEPGRAGARIVNQGHITAASGGLVALVAPGVENAGVIEAQLGKVTLASGNVFTLDMFGDRLVSLAVDDRIAEKLVDANGKPVTTLIEQSGRVQADGGEVVLLTVGAAKDIVDQVINMSGVVTARSLSQRPGVIVLHGQSGEVRVDGELDVSAADTALSANNVPIAGGTVKVLGERPHITQNAQIDASGNGGGQILIGADLVENDRVDRAAFTTIDKGARLVANGGEQGNGGDVRVWADDTVAYAGSIAARGGNKRGDGGYVELAAGRILQFDGTVDVSAPNGKPGTLVRIPEPQAPADPRGEPGSVGTSTSTTPAPGTPTDVPPTTTAPNAPPDAPPATTVSNTPTPAPTGAPAGDGPVAGAGGEGKAGTGGTEAEAPTAAPANETPTPSTAMRRSEAGRVNTAVIQSVDTVLMQPRSAVAVPLDMIRVEFASGLELDDGELFVPDYRLVPRPGGLLELHLPNPFLFGLYPDMQLGNRVMLGSMQFGSGGTPLMFSYSSGSGGGFGGGGGASGAAAGGGGAGAGAIGGAGAGGIGGAGGAGTGGMASAPGRLPQNAQTAEEALAGDIPSDGPVELASSAGGGVASGSNEPQVLASLTGERNPDAGVPPAGTKGSAAGEKSDARKSATVRVVSPLCTGDGRSAGAQAEHQLSEFTPQSAEATKAAITRQTEGACAQGGGARERVRGNQSFVAYGLVNGGRGVAQAADLGRNSPVSGSASDVFRVSYHVITAPRYARGLGLRHNYFCTSPFGENVCARALAFNKLSALPPPEIDKP